MASQQLPLALAYRPALGMADFVIAPGNRDAVACIDRWPDWPSHALAIHGPKGSGKTHLAHVWQARSQAAFLERPPAEGGPQSVVVHPPLRCPVPPDAGVGRIGAARAAVVASSPKWRDCPIRPVSALGPCGHRHILGMSRRAIQPLSTAS